MSTSAFGVEHPISKGVLDAVEDASKGLKAGIGGWTNGKAPMVGTVATKTGQALSAGGKKLSPLVNTPTKKAVAAGAAGGVIADQAMGGGQGS